MRNWLRIALVVAIGLLELGACATAVAEYDAPIGSYGFIVGTDHVTIVSVAPNSPAARAGLAPNDKLLYRALSVRGRRYVVFEEEVPAGSTVTFTIVHGGRVRSVSLQAEAAPGAIARTETLTYALAGLTMGIVGLALVALRPSRMTWAFALVAPPLLFPWSWIFWAQSANGFAAAAFDVFVAALYGMQTAGMIIFASRFPDDRPRGVTRIIDRLGVPVGATVAGFFAYSYLAVRYSAVAPMQTAAADIAIVLPSFAALFALVWTFVTAPGGVRTRLLPVLGTFVVLILTAALQQLIGERTVSGTVLLAVTIAYSLSPALVAVAVAYGVIRHRVMDVSFIVSRTLVYTILTFAAVATFAVIEYIFGRLLERQGIALVLEILAAIGMGLSLNALHSRLDAFIDLVLFRKRHLAEQRLAQAARTLPYASTAQLVDEVLAEEPASALGLASAAVFRRNGAAYERVAASGWTENEAASLEEDDRLVLALRSDLHAIAMTDLSWPRTDLPNGDRQILYAIPVVIGHTVEAIALYGGHSAGEDLDPDERQSLRDLAQAASVGYDRVHSEELRQRLERAEAENASLHSVEQKLTELLNRHLS
jgi:hypothetical protein